jgi:serine/threonine protein kinase
MSHAGLPDVAALLTCVQERLVHRDVSSGNVLLAADGGARLSDFGLAQQLHEPDAVLTGTAEPGQPESVLIGTYGYSTPEYLSTGARFSL